MSYPRLSHFLLVSLALQVSTVNPSWAQDELSFIRHDFSVRGTREPDDRILDGPVSVVVGDFNGDGRQDLATTNTFSLTVSILLGRGDGTFASAQRFEVLMVDPGPTVVADFNRDGQQDLAIAAFLHGAIAVVLGRGDGTFESPQIMQGGGGHPAALAVGDFNGDDRADLVTANDHEELPGAVSILFGAGDGTFPTVSRIQWQGTPASVTVDDFNGDGRADVVVGGFPFAILLGQGDGNFQDPLTIAQSGAGAAVGDVNGDGRPDLARIDFLSGTSMSVQTLLGNGDGTFAPAQRIESSVGPVTAGDFNGDGRRDLVIGDFADGGVSILPGNGDGTFAPALKFGAFGPRSAATGDFDDDGRLDLVTANSVPDSVSVLINNTGGAVAYRLTRIGDEVFSPIIADLNEVGEIVGSTRGITEPRRAILLREGEVIELGDLAGGAARSASATAINDLRRITGTNDIEDASGNLVSRGFIWDGGQLFEIRTEPGLPLRGAPLDINNRGRNLGEIVGFSVSTENLARPFLAGEEGITFLDALVCLGNPGGIARSINNNGVIVGSSNSPAGTRAVIWTEGGMGGITPLLPSFPLETGEAVDVNDRGDAIGFYFNSSGPQMHTAFLWQGDGVTVLPPLDHPEANAAIPASINDQGEIVGSTHLGSGQSIATLWRGNEVLDLNALVIDDDPARDFVRLAFAIKIADSGLIVASGTDSRDAEPRNNVYFLLRPTGVPASSVAVPPPSAASPPPSASSPSASDNNGGGAVDLVWLLLMVTVMSASAARARGV